MDRQPLSHTGSGFRSLNDALIYRADTCPYQPAFHFLSKGEEELCTWSYSNVYQRAAAIGQHLARDCNPGDRILLFYSAGLEFIAAFFGCMLHGFIPVPLPIAYLHARRAALEPIMRVTHPRAVLSDERSAL